MKWILALLAAAALWAQEPAPVPPPQPDDNTPRASLRGTVVNSVTGEPVKKANVTLFPLQGGNQESTQSDAGGNFEFLNLKAGKYTVIVRHPDYINGGRFGFSPLAANDSGVTLQPGDEKQDFKVSVVPGGVLSGRVVDEDGEPLDGSTAQLLIYRRQGGRKQLMPVSNAAADDRGEFRLFNIPAGKYYLRVRSRREIPRRRPLLPPDVPTPGPGEAYAEVFYPSSLDMAGAAKLAVTPAADLAGIEIRLPRIRVVPIRGRVTGASHGQGYRTFLIPHDSPDFQFFDNAEPVRQFAGGRYEADVPKPGAYRLVATEFGPNQRAWAVRDIVVGNTELDGIDLNLQSGIELKGSLEVQSDGADQQPLNQVRIQLESNDGPLAMLVGGASAEAQADGTFQLSGIAPGNWRVRVLGSPGYVKSMRLGNQEVQGDKLEISTAAAGPLKIVIGTKMGHIEGSVQSNDADVKNIAVLMSPDSGGGGGFNVYSISDAQGHFTFEGIAPGTYQLYAVREQDQQIIQQEDIRAALESNSQKVTVEEGGSATAALTLISSDAIRKAAADSE